MCGYLIKTVQQLNSKINNVYFYCIFYTVFVTPSYTCCSIGGIEFIWYRISYRKEYYYDHPRYPYLRGEKRKISVDDACLDLTTDIDQSQSMTYLLNSFYDNLSHLISLQK